MEKKAVKWSGGETTIVAGIALLSVAWAAIEGGLDAVAPTAAAVAMIAAMATIVVGAWLTTSPANRG